MTGDRSIEIKDSTVTASGAVALSLGDISGTVTQTINQLPSSPNSSEKGIKESLQELQGAIEAEPELEEKQKKKALKQLKILAEASQNPTHEDSIEKAEDAKTMLDGIVSKLPAAAALLTICEKVFPKIISFFGYL